MEIEKKTSDETVKTPSKTRFTGCIISTLVIVLTIILIYFFANNQRNQTLANNEKEIQDRSIINSTFFDQVEVKNTFAKFSGKIHVNLLDNELGSDKTSDEKIAYIQSELSKQIDISTKDEGDLSSEEVIFLQAASYTDKLTTQTVKDIVQSFDPDSFSYNIWTLNVIGTDRFFLEDQMMCYNSYVVANNPNVRGNVPKDSYFQTIAETHCGKISDEILSRVKSNILKFVMYFRKRF